jgi:hypothetical protein
MSKDVAVLCKRNPGCCKAAHHVGRCRLGLATPQQAKAEIKVAATAAAAVVVAKTTNTNTAKGKVTAGGLKRKYSATAKVDKKSTKDSVSHQPKKLKKLKKEKKAKKEKVNEEEEEEEEEVEQNQSVRPPQPPPKKRSRKAVSYVLKREAAGIVERGSRVAFRFKDGESIGVVMGCYKGDKHCSWWRVRFDDGDWRTLELKQATHGQIWSHLENEDEDE